MFLINSAIMSRRRSYELLALQVFGLVGKLIMELCMILFLLGICISFHVVMGDLAPSIVAKYFDMDNSSSLRTSLLIGIVVIVILPLCLLRNLDSLASMSACSIGFYVVLNALIFLAAFDRLVSGSWIETAQMFRFENTFRVLPIMTLALSCQSNVFEIYYSIPDADVQRMETVVSQAVNLCVGLYTGVGFLGYVAFIDKDIGGNIIMNFPNSTMTDCVTMIFVVSLAISFPLMLFPCRTSIHSLIYKRSSQSSADLVNFIPESRFKTITIVALLVSLTIGIMLPNIEFVLGLLGSTMGMVIALVLPSLFYIKVQTKRSYHRLLAQGFMLIGIILMVTGTYLHLGGLQEHVQVENLGNIKKNNLDVISPLPARISELPKQIDSGIKMAGGKDDLVARKEPAIPEPPIVDIKKDDNSKLILQQESQKIPQDQGAVVGAALANRNSQQDAPNLGDEINKAAEVQQREEINLKKSLLPEVREIDLKLGKKPADTLHPDAIQKEEKEHKEEVREDDLKKEEILEIKQEKILERMEVQQNEQKQLIEEQKKILNEMKLHKELSDDQESNPDAAIKPEPAENEDKVQKLVVAAKEVLKEISKLPEDAKQDQGALVEPIKEIINSQVDDKKVLDDSEKANLLNKPNDIDNNNIIIPQNSINDAPRDNKVDANQPVIRNINSNLTKKERSSNSIDVKNAAATVSQNSKQQPKRTRKKAKLGNLQNNIASLADLQFVKPIALKNQKDPEEKSMKHDEERRKRDLYSGNEKEKKLAKYGENIAKSGENSKIYDEKPEKFYENSVKYKEKSQMIDVESGKNKLMDSKSLTAPIDEKNVINIVNDPLKDILKESEIHSRDLKMIEENSVFGVRRNLLWRNFGTKPSLNVGRRKKKHKQESDYWDDDL